MLCSVGVLSCRDNGSGNSENNAPIINDQAFEAAEDIMPSQTIGNVVATDADGDELIFSIATNDDNLFEITDGGALSLANGQRLDFETDSMHTIVVRVSDGEDEATATITVNVTDVDENLMPDIDEQQFNVFEDHVGIIGRLDATDMDGNDLTFTITVNSGGLFEIRNNDMLSLVAGQELDFETTDRHRITVEVSDGASTDTAGVFINVEDVNEAPVTGDQEFTVAEDVMTVGSLGADDEDQNSQLTFSILNNPESLFQVSATGVISLAQGQELNFEGSTSHTFTFQVSDGVLTDMAEVTVNVTDANDAPEIAEQEFMVSESINDVTPIGTVVASDEDMGAQLTFSILVNSGSLFEITPGGELSLAAGQSLNFSMAESHTIAVEVSDGELTADAEITIDVTSALMITTLAGGTQGLTDGQGNAAGFLQPRGLTVDGSGNVYVTDANHIRRIDTGGNVSTVAGNTGNSGLSIDGQGSAASFASADHIEMDNAGNLYIGDQTSIRRMTPGFNVTTVFVTNDFQGIDGIDVTGDASFVYLSSSRDIIQSVNTQPGLPIGDIVQTIAGSINVEGFANGTGANSFFFNPNDAVLSDNGNQLFIAERGRIRSIDLTSNTFDVTTLAGSDSDSDVDGNSATASFNRPRAMAMGPDGCLYVVGGPTGESGRSSIRKVDMDGNVTTIIAQSFGTDNGLGIVSDITLDDDGNIYLIDTEGFRVIKIIVPNK